jgi:hypothetical protein
MKDASTAFSSFRPSLRNSYEQWLEEYVFIGSTERGVENQYRLESATPRQLAPIFDK